MCNSWKNSIRMLISGMCIVALFVLLGQPLNAEARTRIRVATQYAIDHPTTRALNDLKERIETATEGRITLRIFPANQLGDYTQVYEELRRGTIDMGLISVPSQFDTRLEVTYLHYLAMNYAEAREIYAQGSSLFHTMDDLHSALGVKFLGFNVEGFGGLGLSKEPTNVRSPTERKNILLRVPPMAVFQITADDQNFQTISIPFAELYTALQTGVADGWSGGPAMVNYLQFRDVIKFFLVNNNFFENTSYLMSERVWGSLSTEDQELFQKEIADLSMRSFDISESNDREYLDKLSAAGIEVIELTDDELQAWADHCRAVTWPKLEGRLTKEMLDRLKAQYQ